MQWQLKRMSTDLWRDLEVDFLIHCARVLLMSDLKSTTEKSFDKTFALNVKAPYFLAQVFPSRLYQMKGSRSIHESRFKDGIHFFHYSNSINRIATLPPPLRYKRLSGTNRLCPRKGSGKRGNKSEHCFTWSYWNRNQFSMGRSFRCLRISIRIRVRRLPMLSAFCVLRTRDGLMRRIFGLMVEWRKGIR